MRIMAVPQMALALARANSRLHSIQICLGNLCDACLVQLEGKDLILLAFIASWLEPILKFRVGVLRRPISQYRGTLGSAWLGIPEIRQIASLSPWLEPIARSHAIKFLHGKYVRLPSTEMFNTKKTCDV